MLRRLSALLILPIAAIATVLTISWLSRRDARATDAARYALEADAMVLLLPTVVIYLISLPFVWRAAKRARARAVAGFSTLTFFLSIAGLLLAMGPLYRRIGQLNPTLADQLFFRVFPFLPVVIAIAVSHSILLRSAASPPASAVG